MSMCHEEEEMNYNHELEMRKAKAEACQEELRAKAASHHQESKAFCEMVLCMI
jgi:hypothetical protein